MDWSDCYCMEYVGLFKENAALKYNYLTQYQSEKHPAIFAAPTTFDLSFGLRGI